MNPKPLSPLSEDEIKVLLMEEASGPFTRLKSMWDTPIGTRCDGAKDIFRTWEALTIVFGKE